MVVLKHSAVMDLPNRALVAEAEHHHAPGIISRTRRMSIKPCLIEETIPEVS